MPSALLSTPSSALLALGDGSLLAPKCADIVGPDVAVYCAGLKKQLWLGRY